jgi:Skp family chaperone for outer membrane proteins
MRMRTIVIALVLAGMAALTLAAQQGRGTANVNVAYASAQKIMAESAPGKAQLAKLQAFQQQKAAELRGRQQTLESTRRDLAASGDATRRVALQQQEQVQRGDLERATAQAQIDLQTLQRQVNVELQAQVKTVLDDLLKSGDVRVVLNADAAVMWGNPSEDMTKPIIDRLNLKAALALPAK